MSSAILGAATLAGMGLMFALRSTVADALPSRAGVTLYVAASDLIPEVNREPGVAMAALGVAIMYAFKLLFQLWRVAGTALTETSAVATRRIVSANS